MNILESVKNRFIQYVQLDTQAMANVDTCPSTPGQLVLAKVLEEECIRLGLQDVKKDSNGYVYASLASNLKHEAPAIGFLAHMDTSPDYSGVDVKPKVTCNYDGGDIVLGKGTVLSPTEFPCLKEYIGQDIITSSGDTLLGADDKAGIAEILTAMEYLIKNPDIPHGKICVGFTPDEEIGRGADKFDLKAFGAAFAYTIDGGEIGELKSENFNAAQAEINVIGKSVHPGAAKGIMVNAVLVAAELVSKMPVDEIPAKTDDYEGFFHLMDLRGCVEHAKLFYSIRDHDKNGFNERKSFIEKIVAELNEKYPKALKLDLKDEYYNMAGPLAEHKHVIDLAYKAMEEAGVKPLRTPIRGGTDGARLSFMGLPCPNIFTGGHNAHGPYEYIPLQSMGKAVEVILNICKSYGKD